jgi:type II secretory pathway pseudopilin PulG
MRRLNSTGETIVEVLLSIVILGFTIVVVFLIARTSLSTGQSASERTQVLNIAETQIETLKYLASNNKAGEGVFGQGSNDFCINPTTNTIVVATDINAVNCGAGTFPDGNMTIRIRYDADGPDNIAGNYDDDTFTITANWSRVGSSNPEKLVQVIRIHPQVLSASASSVCTPVASTNISDYVSGSGISAVRRPGVQDVFYDRRGINPPGTGQQPVKNVNGGRYYPTNPTNYLSPWSNPDIPVDNGLTLDPSCNYDVEWEVYCSANAPVDPLYVCSDQQNEAARINMYSSSTGIAGTDNFSCDGPRIASFSTRDDVLGNPTFWGDTSTVSVTIAPADVRCIEIEHVCVEEQALCDPPNSATSSVFIHSLRWITTP